MQGELTVVEATADVVRLADALGWNRIAIVGRLEIVSQRPGSVSGQWMGGGCAE